MSKTTDYVIERMNEQLDELLGPKPKSRLEKIMDDMIKHGSTAGTVKSSTANINKCSNCHDMILYPDETCPDCGREA